VVKVLENDAGNPGSNPVDDSYKQEYKYSMCVMWDYLFMCVNFYCSITLIICYSVTEDTMFLYPIANEV
jgi:hypothetical protein